MVLNFFMVKFPKFFYIGIIRYDCNFKFLCIGDEPRLCGQANGVGETKLY
jgi:hypothetical protein